MSPFNKNIQAFFALVRAGLWEKDVQLSSFGQIDFNEVYRLAEEQSIVGLVAAGIEHVKDVKVPQELALTFVNDALRLEQQNMAMNSFVAKLIENLREADVYAILVKGQGIAQCYERPLWRSCGDVDLLLSEPNYEKAKTYLLPLATSVEEDKDRKHLGLMMEGWVVELHGTLHSCLSKRMDSIIDVVQSDVFYYGNVRSWQNGNTQVFLPSADNDIIFVFTHILQHFFVEGIGLRQILDWCRLLWTYKDSLNKKVLETRVKKAGLMSEWRAFASFAVINLGFPNEVMPLHKADKKWKRKSQKVTDYILKTGSFGRKIDRSYIIKEPYFVRKIMSLRGHLVGIYNRFKIFPKDTLSTWVYTMKKSFIKLVKGK